MAMKLDKALILKAFRNGKNTHDIAKTSGMAENQIYKMLIAARDEEHANKVNFAYTAERKQTLESGKGR